MSIPKKHRRQFLKDSAKASGLLMMSPLIGKIKFVQSAEKPTKMITPANRIKFAVINIDHPLYLWHDGCH